MRNLRSVVIGAILLLMSLELGCRSQGRPNNSDPEAGIALDLATKRAASIRNVRYDLWFAVPAKASEPILGREAVHFAVDRSQPVVLDFEPGAESVISVSTRGKPIRVRAV